MISLGELTNFRRQVVRDGCTGKRAFGSYADAEVALGRVIRAGADQPQLGTLLPYRCGHCGGWHLGHDAGSDRADQPPHGSKGR
jgi:hypothetical protein